MGIDNICLEMDDDVDVVVEETRYDEVLCKPFRKNRNNLIRIEKMWNGNELGSSSLNELERSLNISICTVSLRNIETLN